MTPFQPAWSCARSRRVESESETTIAVTAMMTATSAVRSWAARALFRLRKLAAAGEHDRLASAEVLATFGPTRPRSRSKPLGRPIGTYDGTCVPACQRQRTNWLHGLPAMSDHLHCIGLPPLSSPKRPKMAESSLFSAGGHLPLTKSVPGNPRTRVLAVPLALSTAGRSMDGPEERGDGLPGSGKGLTKGSRHRP